MSSTSILLALSEALTRLLAWPIATLIETHLPQIWIIAPFNTGKRLLRHESRLVQPNYITVALYAISEQLWYIFWFHIGLVPSFGVIIGAGMHFVIRFSFALPDDLDYPEPSPWQSSRMFVYGMNVALIQVAAAQNAGWLLMTQSLAVLPEDHGIRELGVIFATIGVTFGMVFWYQCWWEFVGLEPSKEVLEYCSRLRQDKNLQREVLFNCGLLLAVRLPTRLAFGMSPLQLLPFSGRREVALSIWNQV